MLLKTLEALKQIGFVQNPHDEKLSYDFDNLELSAFRVINRLFAEVIIVSGVFSDRRTISEIEIQMPLQVDSTTQAAAFIAYGIDQQISQNFIPQRPTIWFDEGRRNFDLLPFIKQQKEYKERPRCLVERDWLKLAFRDLTAMLPQFSEDDSLTFAFQNGIFSIRIHSKTIAFPAVGKDWNTEYQTKVQKFNRFPKRIIQKEIEISIWENNITIAGWRYSLDNSAAK